MFRTGSAAEQDQDAGGDGQNLHDHWKSAKVQFEQRDQSGQDEPDAQQEHSQTFDQLDFGHILTPLKKHLMPCGRPSSSFLKVYHATMALASEPFRCGLTSAQSVGRPKAGQF